MNEKDLLTTEEILMDRYQWHAKYNDDAVKIIYYTAAKNLAFNYPHITMVFDQNNQLLEFGRLTKDSGGSGLTDEQAIKKAEDFISQVSQANQNLELEEVQDQIRSFIDNNGRIITVPILLVKYVNLDNQSFSWVAFNGDQITEYEREAYYDYQRGTGKTERWVIDNWLIDHQQRLGTIHK